MLYSTHMKNLYKKLIRSAVTNKAHDISLRIEGRENMRICMIDESVPYNERSEQFPHIIKEIENMHKSLTCLVTWLQR